MNADDQFEIGTTGSVTEAMNYLRATKDSPPTTIHQETLFQHFCSCLLDIVRAKRASSLRPVIDSEGPVNSALRVLLERLARNECQDIRNRGDARRFLATVVRNLLVSEVRKVKAKRRYDSGQVPIDETTSIVDARFDDPSVFAETEEHLQRWLVDLDKGDNDRRILELTIGGMTPREIADELKVSPRTIQLRLKSMIERLAD